MNVVVCTMSTIIELNNEDAKAFFLKGKSYCTMDFPPYFDFTSLLNILNKEIKRTKDLTNCCIQIPKLSGRGMVRDLPSTHCNVNYKFLSNKDGKYAWRPFQLIHPVIYIALVNCITEKENWLYLQERFKKFRENKKIQCISLPVKSKTVSDKAELISNWWHGLEQQSIKLSMKYDYMFQTDITDCYGSIYTHSIVWALHDKEIAKEKKGDKNLLGNRIDAHLQAMSYGQTNGIPQGSVLMDFISEILLGYIDYCLLEKIKNNRIENYKILRYRDDYRIFSDTPNNIDIIAKILSETLSEVGLKLNIGKTNITDDIVADSIKPDKLYYINNRTILKGLQQKLYFIHSLNRLYPNSGSVSKLLSKFYKQLSKRESIKEDREVLVSIVTDIAVKSPRTYSIVAAILSKLVELEHNNKKKKVMLLSIYNKMKHIPNNGLLQIWLQRIAYPINKDLFSFDEPLCSVVNGVSLLTL